MPPGLVFGAANFTTLPADELRSALKETGIKRIDTAARYQNGESEKGLGRAKFPQDFAIDTKVLLSGFEDPHCSPDNIEKSVLNSLDVLGVSKLNVLYSHGPDWVTPIADQARAFDEQYRRGHFSHLGVSNISPEALREWLQIAQREGYAKPTFFQGQYNLICRSYEETLFPLLRENGIRFAGYLPLAHGFLLGGYTVDGKAGGRTFPPGYPHTAWYNHESMHQAVEKLKAISKKTEIAMDTLNYRWLKYHSALNDDDVIIMGASKIDHIQSAVQHLADGPLDGNVAKEMSDLWEGCRQDGMAITVYKKPE